MIYSFVIMMIMIMIIVIMVMIMKMMIMKMMMDDSHLCSNLYILLIELHKLS